MKFANFFITRPIFATVISVLILIVGGLAYFALPVSQYPDVVLPTVVVSASYPGADPETIAATVATPLEQEINGVEGMLYMESSSTLDGAMQLTITFELGTDVDEAQVLVQNRVAIALPRLPEQVRQIGVQTRKASPEFLVVIHMVSPKGTRDQLYISNFAYRNVRDVLARIDGVGDIRVFGGSEYSMRIWLDMNRIAVLDMTAGDVVAALREQNVQVAAGTINQQPVDKVVGAFQMSVSTKGRLQSPNEFKQIVVKRGADGRVVRLDDVARVELGAVDYNVRSYLGQQNAVALLVSQRPGSNAVATTLEVLNAMENLSKSFPEDLEFRAEYNPTEFVEESIGEVQRTLLEASVLVSLTVFLFLQNIRATIIPLLAIPVSLVGTFAIMQAIGFSLNNLSLFGLVLAIGIVVDDAIVVVENCERLIAGGRTPKEAAFEAMAEVGSALIATALVLTAVFVPTAFLSGISGQFYRQFAITIAASTVLSALVSLTLTPALCALILKPHHNHGSHGEDTALKPHGIKRHIRRFTGVFSTVSTWLFSPLTWFFAGFNRAFDWMSRGYARLVRLTIGLSALVLIGYVALLFTTYYLFTQVPTGFIPQQDQGYVIISITLPDGSTLERTDEVVKEVLDQVLEQPGVKSAVAFVGFSGATRAVSSNAAAIFPVLKDAGERAKEGLLLDKLVADLRGKLSSNTKANVLVIIPPAIRGIGSGGGFKMQLQARGNNSLSDLLALADGITGKARKTPGLTQVFSNFRMQTPQQYADIDRVKAQMLSVPPASIFETLQTYLGSTYINDFNMGGRTYRVTAQADYPYRNVTEDIGRLRTRSTTGAIVPLASLVQVHPRTVPDRVVRYNLYPTADINGDIIRGYSSGYAIDQMEKIAAETIPPGFSYEWTDLAYQQKAAGNTALIIFPLCVLFVFLSLAAQYESWTLPLAIILIVPMCLLFGVMGIMIRGLDNNILTQIGFVVLVGLACKNAILIVEFAKQQEDEGKSRVEAAITAAALRLRPIMMTSLAFILGVVPLVRATGAGAEMRQSLGTAVFSGMIGVTVFGLILTPVFFVVLRYLFASKQEVTPEPLVAE